MHCQMLLSKLNFVPHNISFSRRRSSALCETAMLLGCLDKTQREDWYISRVSAIIAKLTAAAG